jgi:hypothetical protein
MRTFKDALRKAEAYMEASVRQMTAEAHDCKLQQKRTLMNHPVMMALDMGLEGASICRPLPKPEKAHADGVIDQADASGNPMELDGEDCEDSEDSDAELDERLDEPGKEKEEQPRKRYKGPRRILSDILRLTIGTVEHKEEQHALEYLAHNKKFLDLLVSTCLRADRRSESR